jgi:NADH-quinone oxidoreductase subunit I
MIEPSRTELAPAGRGRVPRHASIALDRGLCTSCIICVVECPAWCIQLSSHPEPVPDLPPGARARTHQVLDTFTIDYGTCLYCGICIEECPFDALAWDERLVPPPAVRGELVCDPPHPAD